MFFLPALQVLENLAAEERAPRHVRRPAESDEPVHIHVRLTEDQVRQLTGEFHQWRQAQGGLRVSHLSSQRRIETYLQMMASGGFYRQIGYTMGLAKSTVIAYTHEVAEFLFSISPLHISLPQLQELDGLSMPLRTVDGRMLRVVLYIDGAIVKIQRPDHAGDAFFCGRTGKSCDSLNVQYIMDKFGRVRHVISGIPGATHDRTAVEWSGEFMAYLNALPDNFAVLGDPAYRNFHQRVVTTFGGNNLPQDQLNFNLQCTRLRQIVERGIGATQLKWRIQQLKENRIPAKYGPMFASQCTIAACVLHNRFTNFL